MIEPTKEDKDDVNNNSNNDAFLYINNIPIYFQEDWDTGIGGGLWSTGMGLAKYFQTHPNTVRSSLTKLLNITSSLNHNGDGLLCRKKGLSILELGSGNGLLSICLAAVSKDLIHDIVITDMADHLDLIMQTIKKNSHIIPSDNVLYHQRRSHDLLSEYVTDDLDHSPRCIIMEHLWGVFPQHNEANDNMDNINNSTTSTSLQQSIINGSKKFDFIFGSDVAYRDYLHDPLISSLKQYSHPHTIMLIGVTMSDTKPIFFTKLKQAGFRYDRIADHCMSHEFRGTTFGLFIIQRLLY